MIFDGYMHQLPDIDPSETQEWLDSLDAVVDTHGKTRARYLLSRLMERATESQVSFPATVSTPYVNTIPREQEPWFPGDEHIERRIRAFIRWNAATMVVKANKAADGIGGHLSTFASSASLYEIGFNHFFRGKDDGTPGDHVYFQGHAAPGVYARAFLEGRLTEDDLDHFRREIGRGGRGLSSYPHPRLMPDFWEFPTVSMGLGPITALYHARYNRYLQNRHIDDTSGSRVWAFLGDGECDEPETLGAISLASREQLDNLVFVVNCNLQRLDGPVRGNGKVIQELEAVFRGNGWNVIKVIWGSKWDDLLAQDKDGVLLNKMNTTVDGEFQRYAVENGDFIRDNFFGPDERLRQMVADLSDDDLRTLPRGGHDYRKLYAAYKAATENLGSGRPTVILCKTIKGWTLGPGFEGRNSTHQIKKMTKDQLLEMRDRLHLHDEISEEGFDEKNPPYIKLAKDSIEYQYMMERRKALDGFLPKRTTTVRRPLELPGDKAFAEMRAGSNGQAVSTTMGFTRLLRGLCRDEHMGPRVVPIIPDEARTFGMDALFRELNIYASQGQKYESVDHDLLLSYSESTKGQILEEGITEAGSMASFIAAGTSYATRGVPMVPFFTFYSMFGFQRIGDLIWQAADARTRGFLMAATAGRTTLMGEGLQHQDGHSLVLASTVPAVQAYDPAFVYEVGAIVQAGINRMFGGGPPDEADVFYYITLYNENYEMPPIPDTPGLAELIIEGLYKWADAPDGPSIPATILFSGTAHLAAREAVAELAEHYDVAAELWSATSYKALREEALSAERWNRLHPSQDPRTPRVAQILEGSQGPIIAVSDFMKSVPEQVQRFIPERTFVPLGTDGMGRSDTREALRRHFEIDTGHVVLGVLDGLLADGKVSEAVVEDAIARYGIDPEAVDPMFRVNGHAWGLTPGVTALDDAPVEGDAAAAAPEVAVRRSPLAVVSLVAIVYGFALRLWVSLGPLGRLNADEVIAALMARDLLDGRFPVFFWGQAYAGTLELVPFAALIAIVGDRAAVVALPLVEWIGICVLLYLLARRRLDRRFSLAVVALAALAPAASVWLSTRPMLFYNPTVLLGLGSLLLVDRLADEQTSRARHLRLAAIGLVLGVGWWTSTQILYFAVPALYALVRHRRVRSVGDGALLVGAAVVGAAPWLAYNLRHRGRSLTETPPRDGGIVDHARAQIERGWPMTMGARRPFDERWLLPGPSWLLILAVAAVLVAVAVVFVRVPALRSPLAGVLLAFAVLHLLAPTGSFVGNGRYYFFVVPALAYALVGVLSRIRRAEGATLVLLAVAAVVSTGTLMSMRTVQFGPDDPTALLDELSARGIEHAYANYWVGYPLAWADGDMVVSPNFTERRPDWSTEVRAADVVAYVFWLPQSDDAERARVLAPMLAAAGIDEEFDVGRYRVIVPSSNVPPEALPASDGTG